VFRGYFLLLIILTFHHAYGQQFVVRGRVLDEHHAALPFVNIGLYANDSTLVTGVATDDQGFFSISAKPGNYRLKVSFLSYEEQQFDVPLQNANVDLGNVTLKVASQILETVTVQGEKSQMELNLDKRVFHVGKDLSNISGSASEILDNVPSVTVDVDGNISLRGSQNVRILIDGRPSGLTGISTADALRQLQGNMIETIEVITNPSARYDAEGEVGIINIILKKEKNKGINGSFSLNAGYPHLAGASFNINMRRKAFNFFSSYGLSYRSGPGRGHSFQSFRDADTSFSYRQNTSRERSDLSHNGRAGIDYYFNDKNILTGSVIVRNSHALNETRNNYSDFDSNGMLVREVLRTENEREPERSGEVAISYKRLYAQKGRMLTADIKWIEDREIETADFTQTDFSQDSTGYQKSRNTENERNALAQFDYVHPFATKGKIETGFKSTLRVIGNDFKVEQRNADTENWSVLPQLDNNLIYNENIYAAYVIAGNEVKRFSWQGGMRAELSDIAVELTDTHEENNQDYFNLFPSAHLSYEIKEEKTVQLSYSYRISRPRFRDLMPFSNYSDNRAVNVGNPKLKPEYTHSIEAGYLINWENGSALASTYYRYRTGVITQISFVDSTGFTRAQPVNLATEDAYGLEFNISLSPNKWWRVNSNANFYRAITEGNYQEQEFFSDTYSWTNRTTSRITFFGEWDFQTGFNYRAPRVTPQGKDKSMYFVDLGLSKDIFKGKGTLTFAVRDLLNSRKFRSVVDRPEEGLYSERVFLGRVRQFLLTFTYRLNKKNSDEGDDEDGGVED
jgi:outer membrane receptor protein involved in Fe transport